MKNINVKEIVFAIFFLPLQYILFGLGEKDIWQWNASRACTVITIHIVLLLFGIYMKYRDRRKVAK